jgi:Protein of unknown function (DUF1153)
MMKEKLWKKPHAHNDGHRPRLVTGDADLPHASGVRWVRSRKAAVVKAIADGFISLEEAQVLYQLSAEELLIWQQQFASEGEAGLSMRALTHRRDR